MSEEIHKMEPAEQQENLDCEEVYQTELAKQTSMGNK
jgi:hypothetical protein